MSSKTKAIIVDDEISARHILNSLLENTATDIEVIDMCSNLEEALLSIQQHKPDLVFLDIEMPKYAGYEITSFFETVPFEIIFVTAYDHYAIKAFEVSAVDYVLKPIAIDRLEEALEKYREKAKSKVAVENYQIMLESLESQSISKLVIHTNKGQKIIQINDIISIEADRSYCQIHTSDNNSYIQSKNLKHFENLFQDNDQFIRCHKSWIINSNYVDSYSNSDLLVYLKNGQEVKLSKYKKSDFENLIAK